MITRNSVRAGAAKHIAANMRLLSDARLTNETFDPAGRMGDDAAASVHEFMKGAEGAATSADGPSDGSVQRGPQEGCSRCA